jgi:hypothetical protein
MCWHARVLQPERTRCLRLDVQPKRGRKCRTSKEVPHLRTYCIRTPDMLFVDEAAVDPRAAVDSALPHRQGRNRSRTNWRLHLLAAPATMSNSKIQCGRNGSSDAQRPQAHRRWAATRHGSALGRPQPAAQRPVQRRVRRLVTTPPGWSWAERAARDAAAAPPSAAQQSEAGRLLRRAGSRERAGWQDTWQTSLAACATGRRALKSRPPKRRGGSRATRDHAMWPERGACRRRGDQPDGMSARTRA